MPGIVICLAMAGCADGAPPPDGGPAADPTPSATSSPMPSSSGNSAVNASDILPLGEQALTPRKSLMTVFGFEPIERTPTPPAGSSWYAADIEFCMSPLVQGSVHIDVIRDEFGMQTASGEFQRPDPEFGSPTEIYSEPDRTMIAEECVRGAAVFAVPDDDPAQYVGLYVQGVIRWAADG